MGRFSNHCSIVAAGEGRYYTVPYKDIADKIRSNTDANEFVEIWNRQLKLASE